jgi:hypothetical protein
MILLIFWRNKENKNGEESIVVTDDALKKNKDFIQLTFPKRKT